jgi:hypothetical protein
MTTWVIRCIHSVTFVVSDNDIDHTADSVVAVVVVIDNDDDVDGGGCYF